MNENCLFSSLLLALATFAHVVDAASIHQKLPSYPQLVIEMGMPLEKARSLIPDLKPGSLSLRASKSTSTSDYWQSDGNWRYLLNFADNRLVAVMATLDKPGATEVRNVLKTLRSELAAAFQDRTRMESGRIGLADLQAHPMTVEIYGDTQSSPIKYVLSGTAAEVSLLVIDTAHVPLSRFYKTMAELKSSTQNLKAPILPPGARVPVIDYTDLLAQLPALPPPIGNPPKEKVLTTEPSLRTIPEKTDQIERSKPMIEDPKTEKHGSWLVWGVLIVAASTLLWLLVKNRK